MLFALVGPSELYELTPLAFLRIPAEGLLIAGLLLLLPGHRKAVALAAGALLGLLAVLKLFDMGFNEFLDRPFDPVFDWGFLDAGYVYLSEAMGRTGAIIILIVAGVLVVGVLVLMALSVLRLSRYVRRSQTTGRVVAGLAVVWLVLAVFGTPVAAHDYYDRVVRVGTSLHDEVVFSDLLKTDAFRDTPGDQLLTALRGKDVVFAFVESYGRITLEDPEIAPAMKTFLDAGTARLTKVGFAARSGYLSSPTAGGGSWLAHGTFMGGVWVDNQQRYTDLLETDRMTLNKAFGKAGWRTVGVMPGVIKDWPEGAFFGNDKVYGAADLGYAGPKYSFATMPDQYTLSAFQRLERATAGRKPIMADIPLISSHAPWDPVPEPVDWAAIGDGSIYPKPESDGGGADVVLQRDPVRVKHDYQHAVEYSVDSLLSYVEHYGDDNLVIVFLGDHQPARVVTGVDADRDVPIAVVAKDPAVLAKVDAWGWQPGIRPGDDAPVWKMDEFRDRFLTTFS